MTLTASLFYYHFANSCFCNSNNTSSVGVIHLHFWEFCSVWEIILQRVNKSFWCLSWIMFTRAKLLPSFLLKHNKHYCCYLFAGPFLYMLTQAVVIDKQLDSINKRSFLSLHMLCILQCVALTEHGLWSVSLWLMQTDSARSLHTYVNAVAFKPPTPSFSHTHKHTNQPCWTLLILIRQNPQKTKSNLWNWQGPSAGSIVSLDQFMASQERKAGNKTVRISAIPTVIFITTTWVERKRERSQSTVKEVYHYKRLFKLTLVKLDFSHLEYKGMQSQKIRKKTNSEKVKQR